VPPKREAKFTRFTSGAGHVTGNERQEKGARRAESQIYSIFRCIMALVVRGPLPVVAMGSLPGSDIVALIAPLAPPAC